MITLAIGKNSRMVRLLKIFLSMHFPYVFQRVRLEDGNVLRKLDYTGAGHEVVVPGYYVMVEVCRYRDAQVLYPSDYAPRRSLVRVSKEFYNGLYIGASLKVFCQFHRVHGHMAKMWLAR